MRCNLLLVVLQVYSSATTSARVLIPLSSASTTFGEMRWSSTPRQIVIIPSHVNASSNMPSPRCSRVPIMMS